MRADVLVITAAEMHYTANSIREDSDLTDVPEPFLKAAARHMRAGAYSAWVAARRLDRLAEEHGHAEQVRAAHVRAEDASR